MRAYVFTDPALAPVAARFVWLSVDTEKEQNQQFLDRFPIESWPTLLVIDPRTGQPMRKWLGSATVPELVARLDEASDAYVQMGGAPAPAPSEAEAALARAGELDSRGDHAGALKAYRAALQKAPPDWPQRPQAIEGMAFALQATGKSAECAQLALSQIGTLPKGTSLANVASTGLMCALQLPKRDPLAAKEPVLEQEVASLAADRSVPLLADDRSGLYDTLVAARQQRGDKAGVKQAARAWRDFLDAEAAKAKTPEARAVFDSHRLSADLALGEPEKAIPMLEQSERDLPNDYNAPARLAYVYLQMHQPQKALEASKRAEKKVYGPRTVSVLLNEARAYAALGQKAQAAKVLDRADALVASLTNAQGRARLKQGVASTRAQLIGSR